MPRRNRPHDIRGNGAKPGVNPRSAPVQNRDFLNVLPGTELMMFPNMLGLPREHRLCSRFAYEFRATRRAGRVEAALRVPAGADRQDERADTPWAYPRRCVPPRGCQRRTGRRTLGTPLRSRYRGCRSEPAAYSCSLSVCGWDRSTWPRKYPRCVCCDGSPMTSMALTVTARLWSKSGCRQLSAPIRRYTADTDDTLRSEIAVDTLRRAGLSHFRPAPIRRRRPLDPCSGPYPIRQR